MDEGHDEIYPPSTPQSVPKRPPRHPRALAILAATLAIGALLAFWGDGSITSAPEPSNSIVPLGDPAESTQATNRASAPAAGTSDTAIAATVDHGGIARTCVTASPVDTRRDVEGRFGVELDTFNATEQAFLIAAAAAGADVAAMTYVVGS
jgi:hypothetical protein